MLDPLQNWIHPEFVSGAADRYAITGIAGYDGLSFLVTNQKQEALALKVWDFASLAAKPGELPGLLQGIREAEPLLGLPYQRTTWSVSTPWVTLVPKRLFAPESRSAYFKLLIQVGDYHFGHAEIPDESLQLVYAVEQPIWHALGQIVDADGIAPVSQWLIHYWLGRHWQSPMRVCLNIRGHSAQIAVVDRRNLLYFNTFTADTANDFLYFILLAFDQFQMNPDEVPLYVSGAVSMEGELYRQLYRFVRTIKMIDQPLGVHLPSGLMSGKAIRFWDLLLLASGADRLSGKNHS